MIENSPKKLFHEYELASLLENTLTSITSQVGNIDEKVFLHTPADKIVARLVADNSLSQLKIYEKFVRVRSPIKCKMSDSSPPIIITEDSPKQSFINGIKVRIEIPYSGDERLWRFRPTIFNAAGGPTFSIKNSKLVKDYIHPLDAYPHQAKSEFLQDLRDIKKYLSWQSLDIQRYRDKVREVVEEKVAERRSKLHKVEMLIKSTTINIKPKDRSAEFCPINTRHKILSLVDTPSITEDDFINIIRVIRHIGYSCEKTPRVFKVHNESELCDIITSTLNTHFEDSSENDIFVKENKKAVSISKGEKRVFIGMCKVWSSENRFIKTLDQLLELDSWQDCKATLVIFNKNMRYFSELLTLATQKIMEHPAFISRDNIFDENEWRFTMQSPNDKSCKIIMHVMIFDLYTEEPKPRLNLTEQEMDFFRK